MKNNPTKIKISIVEAVQAEMSNNEIYVHPKKDPYVSNPIIFIAILIICHLNRLCFSTIKKFHFVKLVDRREGGEQSERRRAFAMGLSSPGDNLLSTFALTIQLSLFIDFHFPYNFY